MKVKWLAAGFLFTGISAFTLKNDFELKLKEKYFRKKPILYLPEDLEATLWAESPKFFNPTNMDVDAKGRIWVTEAVNYRLYNNKPQRPLNPPGRRPRGNIWKIKTAMA